MKKVLVIISAATLALVGCNQDNTVKEPSGAQGYQTDKSQSALPTQQNSVDQQKIQSDQAPADSSQKIYEASGAAKDPDIEKNLRSNFGMADTTTPGTSTTSTTAGAYSNVKFTVKDGAVTLTGTVKTDADKAEAEAKAKAISGVKSVDNQIEVKAE
jgi:hypothetical protein